MRSRYLFAGYLVVIATCLTGTRACQESYDLGAQSTVKASPSPTDDPGTISSTTTTTSTSQTTEPSTSTTEPDTETSTTSSVTSTTEEVDSGPGQIIKALHGLSTSKDSSEDQPKSDPRVTGVGQAADSAPTSNWLGRGYVDQEEISGVSLDTDGDGFTDALEQDFGTNEDDRSSRPPPPRSRLSERLDGIDDDRDGIRNTQEITDGTDPKITDSDRDNFSDGAEKLNGTDPLNASRHAYDSDGDGLSDNYEAQHGTSMHEADTDMDGANDGVELAIGSNPRDNDTDKDGVLDGKELEYGADPVAPEHSLRGN